MSTGARYAESSAFDVGDRVAAAVDIGGIWRPRVRRATVGIVIARAPGGELEVHFEGGGRELVEPTMIELAS